MSLSCSGNGPFPVCCFICRLKAVGFEDEFVRSVGNSSNAIWKYAEPVKWIPYELVKPLNDFQIRLLAATAKALLEERRGHVVPVTHNRYYQDRIVSTGIPELDSRLKDGGLAPGDIYVFIEPEKNMCGSRLMIDTILENSQKIVHQPGLVTGMEERCLEDALVFHSRQEEPGYLFNGYAGLTDLKLRTDPVTKALYKEDLDQVERFLRGGQRAPGIVIIEDAPPFNDYGEGIRDPAIKEWLMVLGLCFPNLKDTILIFRLDSTQFKGSTNLEAFVEKACSGTSNNPHQKKIIINGLDPEKWKVY